MYRVYFVLLMFCLFCVTGLVAQIEQGNGPENEGMATAAGVHFIDGSWDDALHLAQQTGKMIYAVVGGPHCAACVILKRDVLTDAKVADFYNRHFICYNIEKEPNDSVSSALMQKRWRIKGVPTQLFLSSTGEVLHRVVGAYNPLASSLTASALLNARSALDTNTQSSRLEAAYDSGNRDPQVLFSYAIAASLASELSCPACEDLAREYFATQSDAELSSGRNWQAYRTILRDVRSREYRYLCEHLDEFVQQHGAQDVFATMLGVIVQHVETRVSTVTNADRQAALRAADSLLPSIRMNFGYRDSLIQSCLLNVYTATRSWDHYAEAGGHLFDSAGVRDGNVLVPIAWTMYYRVEDSLKLQTAARMVLASIEQRDSYSWRRLYALLLQKRGAHVEARRAAEWALELAGPDDSGVEELRAMTDLQKAEQSVSGE